MNFLLAIKKGKAILNPTGLRCAGPRTKQPDQICNKLLVKRNIAGQIAGAYRCERCGQDIEVELAARP